MIVPPKKPTMISPGGPKLMPKPAKPGMVSSHGPGSGAPPTAGPMDPLAQRGYDSYARKLSKLGPGGDPAQMKLMQQGMAHYARRGAMAPPAGGVGGGITPPGPLNKPPTMRPITPPGGGNLPPGAESMGPLPPGIGPGPMMAQPEGPAGQVGGMMQQLDQARGGMTSEDAGGFMGGQPGQPQVGGMDPLTLKKLGGMRTL